MKDSISRWSLHYEGWAAEHNISCLPRGNRSRGKGLSLLSPCRGGAPPFSPALPSYSVSLLFLLFAPAVTKPHSGRFSSAFRPFCSANPAAGSRNMQIDNLHKISHKLIRENQLIVSENLSVSNMIKNHNLAKAISDCGWYELTRQISYKSEWNNRQYIKIGRFTKSSQPCNVCGYINTETKDLSVREWICPQCGTKHDRDINAAINILNEGLRLLKETA